MALRQTKKISELPALSPASLDTTFVVGISGSTTYKISINNLTSSLDTTFATDLVTNALSSSLDTKLSTSSFNSYTASISTGSLVTSISNLNIFTASVTTASIVTSISNLNTFTASVSTASLVTSISNLNTFTASQSTSSLVDRLNTIESVSGSWITESETGSFLTSLNGAISSSTQISDLGFVTGSYTTINSFNSLTQSFNSYTASISTASLVTSISNLNSATSSYLTSLSGAISSSSQLTSSFDTRYALSSSISATPTLYLLEAHANVTYTLPDSFTEDPCRYSVVNNTVNVSSSWFNTSTYTFTPQKAGYWEITAAYDVYRNSEAAMAIKKNNGIVVTAGAFGAVAQQVTKIVYLNGSTDFINIVNVGGASNSRSQYEGRSWFQARWVGE
jgi:hypothetical protein